MIKVSVDVDIDSKELVVDRCLKQGVTFPICLMVEHANPCAVTPVEFDTLILEVLFNDEEKVLLRVDPNERPSAGDLAANSPATVDYFSGESLKAGSMKDEPPFSMGSRLMLERPEEAPPGPYKGRTGRAGLQDLGTPFSLRPGDPARSFALGKVNAGLTASLQGTSSILVTGLAFLGSTPVPVIPVRGNIWVI